MWLNKAQIKGGFYLSIECFLYPCNYTIKTNFKDNVEIDFDRAYTYYVTEDNKEMEFNIKGNPGMIFYDDEETSKINCKISIQAKGNKELESEYISSNIHSKKYRGYHAYIIDKQEPKEINLKMKVIGKVGDFIEIGALFINGDNYAHTIKIYNVFGFFKKGVL